MSECGYSVKLLKSAVQERAIRSVYLPYKKKHSLLDVVQTLTVGILNSASLLGIQNDNAGGG